MNNLSLIKSEPFGTISCDFYKDENNEIFMTREQIGKALEYNDPIRAISKIHERNNMRLCKYSVVVKLTTTDNKQYDTFVYTAKGIYEICRYSRQPKADEFFDWVYEVIESIRKHGIYAIESIIDNPSLISQAVDSLKEERRIRKLAEQQLLETTAQLEQQQPLVNFANKCMKSNNNILVREFAKILFDARLIIGEKTLWQQLREWGLILKNKTEPSQYALEQDIFEVDQYPVFTGYDYELKSVTKITPNGQLYLLKKFTKTYQRAN